MTQIYLPNAEQMNTLIELLDKRIVVIASVSGVSVEAGASTQVINPQDISKYPIQFITTFADAGHDYHVEFFYRTPWEVENTFGVNTTEANAIYKSSGKIRGASEWVDAKGGMLKVNIRNNDTVNHTYDLVLYGVR